jgi:outer membrane protein assembly factor BamB
MNLKNKIIFLSFCLALVACQSGTDTVESPAELKKFSPNITLQKKWSKSVFSEKPVGKVNLIFNDSNIFSFSEEGEVVAYQKDGSRIWIKDLNLSISSGLGFGNNSLFLTTDNGEVISINSTNGETNWTSKVSGEALSPPSTNGLILAIQTTNGKVTALDSKNGKFIWEYTSTLPSLSLRGTSQPVFDKNFIYIGFANGNLAKIESRSGVVQWEIPITVSKASSEIERVIDVDSKPAVSSNGLAFGVSYQGDITALDSRNGRLVWRQPASSTNDILNVKGSTFLIDEFDILKSFDSVTGSTKWSSEEYRLRNLNSLSRYKNMLIVGDFKGYLHFIDMKDGTTQGRAKPSGSQVISIAISEDFVASLDQSGKLSVLTVK